MVLSDAVSTGEVVSSKWNVKIIMNDKWVRILKEVAMVNYKHDLSSHMERLRKRIYNLSQQMKNKPLSESESRELLSTNMLSIKVWGCMMSELKF
jgi:hypothetical protein